MNLFARIFSVVLFLFLASMIVMTIGITKRFISDSKQVVIGDNSLLGETMTSELQRWQSEGRWPFQSLAQLSKNEEFEFWWVVGEDGEIFLANNPQFSGTEAGNYFSEFATDWYHPSEEPEVFEIDAIEMLLYQQSFKVGHSEYAFVFGQSLRKFSEIRSNIIQSALWISLAVIVVLGILMYFSIRHFLRPLAGLTEGVRRIGEGDLHTRVEHKGSDEIGFLADSVNTMAAQLDARQHAQNEAEQELIATNEELLATSDALKHTNNELEQALEEARRSQELEKANKALKEKELALEIANFDLKNSRDEITQVNEELTATNDQLVEQRDEIEQALTHLQETQTQLLQSEKMASLGVLTAGVAHEINNPLNFIHGAQSALRMKFKESKESDESLIELLDVLDAGVERAAAIVSSLNQFSRQTNRDNEECKLHTILDNCHTMLHSKLKGRVEVTKDYAEQEIILQGNAGNLHQVFINILGNSEQAIQDTGSIHIHTSLRAKKVRVSIKDSGEGISEEHLAKVMDPFYTTKDPGVGTGLGLSIVYSIVKDHGGDVALKSTPGKGTEVILTLPVVPG